MKNSISIKHTLLINELKIQIANSILRYKISLAALYFFIIYHIDALTMIVSFRTDKSKNQHVPFQSLKRTNCVHSQCSQDKLPLYDSNHHTYYTKETKTSVDISHKSTVSRPILSKKEQKKQKNKKRSFNFFLL